jgi:hypothetical protein
MLYLEFKSGFLASTHFINKKGEKIFFSDCFGIAKAPCENHGKIARAIIHRLENPRGAKGNTGKIVTEKGISLLHRRASWQNAKIKKTLSIFEKQDAAQIAFLHLARYEKIADWKMQKGKPKGEKIPFSIIKLIFRSCRKDLRMNHAKNDEIHSIDLTEKDFPFDESKPLEMEKRIKLAKKIRLFRAACFKRFDTEKAKNRKAKSALKGHLEFLRYLLSGINPFCIYSHPAWNESARRKRAERFKEDIFPFVELQKNCAGLAQDMSEII